MLANSLVCGRPRAAPNVARTGPSGAEAQAEVESQQLGGILTWHRLSRRSARSGYLPHSARIRELSVCSCRPLAEALDVPLPLLARGDDGGEPPPAAAAAAAGATTGVPAPLPAAAPAAAARAAEAEAGLGWRRASRLTRSTASSSRCSWVHMEISISCIWSLGTTPCGAVGAGGQG